MRDDPIQSKAPLGAIKPYKKEMPYSYTLGASPTIELLQTQPKHVLRVLLHSSYVDDFGIVQTCKNAHIPVETADRVIARLSGKENCYAVAVFEKSTHTLHAHRPHVVLDGPRDMGNLGTIIRTMVAFGLHDLALISPCADAWHPKVARASMGALFKLRVQEFESFTAYRAAHDEHQLFTFMLGAQEGLTPETVPDCRLYSLIFGNEASGLDASYRTIGQSFIIPQTPDVDSLNLSIAVGIATCLFTSKNR